MFHYAFYSVCPEVHGLVAFFVFSGEEPSYTDAFFEMNLKPWDFAAGMLLPLFAEVPAYIIFALFGISYIIIGWDIIWKAFCNIRQGEAFDE